MFPYCVNHGNCQSFMTTLIMMAKKYWQTRTKSSLVKSNHIIKKRKKKFECSLFCFQNLCIVLNKNVYWTNTIYSTSPILFLILLSVFRWMQVLINQSGPANHDAVFQKLEFIVLSVLGIHFCRVGKSISKLLTLVWVL